MCIMKTKERVCPECEGVVEGRSDKVFCSKNCKNAHNTKRTKQKKDEGLKFRFSGQTP